MRSEREIGIALGTRGLLADLGAEVAWGDLMRVLVETEIRPVAWPPAQPVTPGRPAPAARRATA